MTVRPVLGLDIGGTWTRVLVADEDGTRLGASRCSGANPVAHGVSVAAGLINLAVRQALDKAGVDAGAVAACVVGLAGASKLAGDADTAAEFAEIWRRVGVGCVVDVVSDVTTAFAGGTPEPVGSVLIAGTGAIAAAVEDRRPIDMRGGHGWLLGDEGSGFWIGREAVRETIAAIENATETTSLAAAISEAYELSEAVPPARPVAPLIAAVSARSPVDLAQLVPLVADTAERGDQAASRILHEAADHLVAILERVRARDDASPIVLAGGVLTPGSYVHGLVSGAIAELWPKSTATVSADGAAGAAWLAALRLLGDGDYVRAGNLHARLVG